MGPYGTKDRRDERRGEKGDDKSPDRPRLLPPDRDPYATLIPSLRSSTRRAAGPVRFARRARSTAEPGLRRVGDGRGEGVT